MVFRIIYIYELGVFQTQEKLTLLDISCLKKIISYILIWLPNISKERLLYNCPTFLIIYYTGHKIQFQFVLLTIIIYQAWLWKVGFYRTIHNRSHTTHAILSYLDLHGIWPKEDVWSFSFIGELFGMTFK